MSYLRRAFQTRDVTGSGDPWAVPSNGSLSKYSSAGVPVDQDSILSLPAVVRCVDLVSSTVAGLPLDAVTTNGHLRTPVEPAPQICEDPFGGANQFSGLGLTRFEGIAQIMVSLLFRGNAYVNIALRGTDGNPELLQVLNPDAVQCWVDNVKGSPTIGERMYKVNNQPFPAQNMVHIRGLTLPGQPVGLSVLGYAKRTIGLGIAAEEYGSMFFGNGTHMSGYITIPGDMNPDLARTIKESFESKHGGMRHAHEAGVLTGGAEWKPLTVSPEEAQFLQTRQMQTGDIAMLFGIPPHMLGQVDRTTSWGKGIEEQTLGFIKFTIMKWVKILEDAWSAMLPSPVKARFNLDHLQRPDTTTRFTAYGAARNASLMTPNEIRALENLPPLDGGDDLFAALNSAHNAQPGDEPKDPVTGAPIGLLPQKPSDKGGNSAQEGNTNG